MRIDSPSITGSLIVSSSSSNEHSFMGANVGIGLTNPVNKLHVRLGSAVSSAGTDTGDTVIFEDSTDQRLNLITGTSRQNGIFFSDTTRGVGRIDYIHSTDTLATTVGSTKMLELTSTKISGSSTSTGSFGMGNFSKHLGVGTTSPSSTAEIAFSRGSTLPTTYDVTHANSSAPLSDGELVIKNTANNEVGSFSSLFFYAGQQSATPSLAGVGKITLRKSSASNFVSEMGFWTRKSDGDLNQNMVIDSDGNVGIGTSSPDTNLHIHKASAGSVAAYSEAVLAVENSGNTAINLLSGNGNHGQIAFGDDGDNDKAIVGYDHGADRFYVTVNGSSTKYLVVDSTGNVGVGTSSPARALHVVGDALVTGILTAQEFHTEFVSASVMFDSGSTKFGDDTVDIHQMTGSLKVSGSLGINLPLSQSGAETSLDVGTLVEGGDGVNFGVVIRGQELPGTNLELADGIGLKFEIPIDTATSNIGASIETIKASNLDSNSETQMIFKTSGNDETLDTALTIAQNQNVFIEAAKSLYFDGGSHTYISETSNDVLDVYVGGVNALKISPTEIQVPRYITHMGDGNNYIDFETDTITFVNDGGNTLQLHSNHDVIVRQGNLGIGTSSPAYHLHISASSGANAIQFIESNTADKFSYLGFKVSGTDYNVGVGGSTTIFPNKFYIYDNSAAELRATISSTTLELPTANYLISGSSTSTGSFGQMRSGPQIITNNVTNNSALTIDNNTEGYAIVSNAKWGPNFTQDSADGRGLEVSRNNNDTETHPLVTFTSNHTATTQPTLKIQQDGAGNGIKIDQNGNSSALEIDTEATSAHGIYFNSPTITTGNVILVDGANSLTTGRLAFFGSNSSDTSTRNLVEIQNINTSATGATALKITQNSTGDGIHYTGGGHAISGSSTSTGSFGMVFAGIPSAGLQLGSTSNGHALIQSRTIADYIQYNANGGHFFTTNGANYNYINSDNNFYNASSIIQTSANGVISGSSTSTGSFGQTNVGGRVLFTQTNNNSTANSINLNTNGFLYIAGGSGGIILGDDSINTAIQINDGTSINFDASGGRRMILDANSKISLSNNDSGTANTVFGYGAGTSLADGGIRNVIIGHNAGDAINTGDFNTMIGYEVGTDLTTGERNVFLGYGTGANVTAATHNTAIGMGALGDVTNHVVGTVALGYASLAASGLTTAANYTVAIGYLAANALTSGAHNTAIGYNALAVHTTGNSNTVIGYGAMDDTDAGSTSLGSGDNVFIGEIAGGGTWADAASNANVGIGNNVMDAAMNGALNNTAVGHAALGALTTGDNNVALGSGAGGALTSGVNNVIIGISAGDATIDTSYHVLIGGGAGGNGDIATDGVTAVGYLALHSLINGARNTAVGYSAGAGLTGGGDNTFIGYNAGYQGTYAATTAERNVAVGAHAFGGGAGANITGQRNTAIGCESMLEAEGAIFDNTAVGHNSLQDVTTGQANTAVGTAALTNLTTGRGNIGIGSGSMGGAVVTGNDNIAVGSHQTLDALTSGTYNVAIGHKAGTAINTGVSNQLIGLQTGLALTTASSSIAIGSSALAASTTGNQNIAIGSAAMNGGVTTGDNNIAIGTVAGDALTSGKDNIFMGNQAGVDVNSGHSNVLIGLQAGHDLTTGFHNVAIGSFALDECTDVDYAVCIGFGAGSSINSSDADSTVAIGNESLLSLTDGQRNVAVGYGALKTEDAGDNSTAVGYEALKVQNNNTGANTAVGMRAGLAVSSGYSNTLLGSGAGATLSTGYNNTYIGRDADGASGRINSVALGHAATAKGDNTFQLGNDSTVAWTFGTGSLQTWDAANVFRTIQLDTVTLACQNAGKPQGQAWLTNNFYYDDSNNRFQPIHTGESAAININDDGNIRFITSNGSDTVGSEITTLTALSIDNGGVVSGDLNDTSDRNLKKNIVSLSDTTEGVKKLNPVSFDWKHSNDKSLGFIAQEVEEIYPELVKNKEGSKSIKTAGIVAVLTKAVQELMEKNEALEKRLEELEGNS